MSPVDHPWEPISVSEVARIFAGLDAPWWIGGGHAVELAVGRAFREHGDVDVGVLRRDHLAVRRLLSGWDCWAADPAGSLRPWPVDETLPARVHDIWVREATGGPWRLQLMLDESDGDDWVYRRAPGIRRPLDTVVVRDAGPPRLAPEIQLLYKAKHRRPKDDADFAHLAPLLTGEQRSWLAAALTEELGDHPWLEKLPPR
ncbi:amino acid transporter [Nonomuraea sp. NPDC023979]|uniref:nucleotidyltransferase domain-containing protein n=1 Tax=Nonomuraea sp. NPDC023979 TaxID=3154796 RepID=UPI0033E93DA9